MFFTTQKSKFPDPCRVSNTSVTLQQAITDLRTVQESYYNLNSFAIGQMILSSTSTVEVRRGTISMFKVPIDS